jgi:divalent metal cation (Fe/Co/Zn/Cd) transporter
MSACPEEIARETLVPGSACPAASSKMTRHIRRLQVITLVWMLAECVIALTAAWRASSPVLLAFGADSFVELASSVVVLLQFVLRATLSEARASKLAGILLFILAGVITLTSAFALWRNVGSETSWMGIGVTVAALIVMPILSSAKRRAGKATGNLALSADAVQSATCAYLAAITLAGLGLNAIFHIRWTDPAAALAAVPVICVEGREALRGEACCRSC